MHKLKVSFLFVLLSSFSLHANDKISGQTKDNNEQTKFFKLLSRLCDKTYDGKTIYPNIPSDPFVGVKLSIYFEQCSNTEIQVPFHVGNDTSRTWIITKTDKGLLLKHDHRHKDGTPDEITMYGGYADINGSSISQSFHADEQTTQLIPAAKTNVWKLSFDNKAQTLTYYLERNSKKRYKAVFNLK